MSLIYAISETGLYYGETLMRHYRVFNLSQLMRIMGRAGRLSAINMADANVIHMSSAISNTGLDLENRYIMTGQDVDVRDRPRQSGYVTRTLSYQVVDVGAATYDYEGDIWVLVSFFCFGSSFDDMGWVRLTDLMEYTEDNYQMLRYPVKVREGCVDLETGEPVEWDTFAVDYVDSYAIVGREGGRSHKVSPSDIIYPEFYNNSPYNFPIFSDK